jgi:hypothetical protein
VRYHALVQAWEEFFDARAQELEENELDSVFRAASERLSSGDEDGLKRFARRLHREPPETIDPWRVQLVLRRLERATTLRFGGSPLLRSVIPAHGPNEPDPYLRAWALVRTALEHVEAGQPMPLEVPGASEVWWWLTGDRGRVALHELRNTVAFALATDRALAPFHLISSRALSARRAELDGWSRALVELSQTDPPDALQSEFMHAEQDAFKYIDGALDAAELAVRGELKTALSRATSLLGAIWQAAPRGAEPASLALFCAEARALGIIGALELSDDALDRYRRRIAERLATSLDALLSSQPLSLLRPPVDSSFWRAVAVLVRECVDAGDRSTLVPLLGAVASSGSWTGSCARPVARITAIVLGGPFDPAERESLVQRFVHRFAFASARRRSHSASRLWRSALERYAKVAAAQPTAADLELVWGPNARDSDDPDALERWGRSFAWTEVDDDAPPASLAAWWDRAEQRGWLDASESPVFAQIARSCRRNSAPRVLSEPLDGRGTGFSLHIDALTGRHGERYVLPKLFGVRGGSVTLLAQDERYKTPFDQRPRLDALAQAMTRFKERAALGTATRTDLQPVVRALGALASEDFWEKLGTELGREPRAVELTVADAAAPWEIVPVTIHDASGEARQKPLAMVAPAYRARGVAPGAERSLDRVLVLFDPAFESARDEVAIFEELWPRKHGDLVVVHTLEGFRALAHEHFDVVHYAGHQGPASDSTPSLALGDDRLPLVELVDAFHHRPPALVFLNACSTLAPSRELESVTVFGSLEPLLRSRVPAILGTLWDIDPPNDGLFIRTFYGALRDGAGSVDALFSARSAVSVSARWAPWWPAYVLLSPPAHARKNSS